MTITSLIICSTLCWLIFNKFLHNISPKQLLKPLNHLTQCKRLTWLRIPENDLVQSQTYYNVNVNCTIILWLEYKDQIKVPPVVYTTYTQQCSIAAWLWYIRAVYIMGWYKVLVYIVQATYTIPRG